MEPPSVDLNKPLPGPPPWNPYGRRRRCAVDYHIRHVDDSAVNWIIGSAVGIVVKFHWVFKVTRKLPLPKEQASNICMIISHHFALNLIKKFVIFFCPEKDVLHLLWVFPVKDQAANIVKKSGYKKMFDIYLVVIGSQQPGSNSATDRMLPKRLQVDKVSGDIFKHLDDRGCKNQIS